jgi:ppGpp synthetase/RelA/SpoT-type nucleotidyltranferase
VTQEISKPTLSNYYNYMETFYSKALTDVMWHFTKFLDGNVALSPFRDSIRVTSRVKSEDSILRKCKRLNVSKLDDISNKIEDVIGIRAATVNKEHARSLFEALEHSKDNWFCSAISMPKFVPYTVSERNKYSLESGYQAYHVTFVYSQSYKPLTEAMLWPVEIQVMSQLWEFWADYSRKYFYGSKQTNVTSTYNVVISRLLDAADDLMSATTEVLRQQKQEVMEESSSAR